MKSYVGSNALREWHLIASISVVSFSFSLSFLDPINWPKQIALFTVSVFLFMMSILNQVSRPKKVLAIEVLFVVLLLLSWFIPQLYSDVATSRFLWGVFGRNNGFITQISLIMIAYSFYLLLQQGLRIIVLVKWGFYSIFVSSIYAVIQYLGLDPVPWSKKNEVFSFFGNTNFASAIFSLGISFFLVLYFAKSEVVKGVKLIVHLAMALVMLFSLFQTNSIQGLAGLAITLFLLVVHRVVQVSRLLGIGIFIFTIPVAAVVFLGLLGEGPFGTILYQYTLRLRMFYWFAGIRMGLENPWSGVGVDSYGDFYRAYRPEGVISLTGADLITNNAHNPLIQVFATLGLPAFLLVTGLVFIAGFIAFRILLSNAPRNPFMSGLAALFISAWSMAFFSIDNIGIAVWNWMLLGAVIGSARFSSHVGAMSKKQKYSSSTSHYSRLISTSAASLAFAICWYSASPNRSLATTFSKQISSQDSVLVNERSAVAVKVANSRLTREAEYAYAADAFLSIGLSGKAIQALAIGNKVFPRDFEILDKLAFLSEQNGDYQEVLDIRIKQIRLEQNNWRLWYALAKEYLRNGELSRAASFYPKIEKSASLLAEYPSEELKIIKNELNGKS